MKVECIDDTGTTYIKKGEIYTVLRKVSAWTNGDPAYELVELDILLSPIKPDSRRAHWFTRRFRPLTDISALTKLTKIRELEDA